MSVKPVGTPCIGVCSTTFGDLVCRGCKRFLHEIVDWNRYDEAEKRLVWQRLDSLLALVVSHYFRIDDSDRLDAAMAAQNLRRQPQLSAAARLPELLRAAGPRLLDWHAFGISPTAQAVGLDARTLYDRISRDCHTLAEAHYQLAFTNHDDRLAGSEGAVSASTLSTTS